MTYKVYLWYNIDIENSKGVFESIFDDEKKHRRILFTIIEFLTEQNEDKKNPKFKLKRPDSWYSPPRQ